MDEKRENKRKENEKEDMMELILFIATLPFTITMFVMKYGLSAVFWFLLGSYLWSLFQSFVERFNIGGKNE